MITKFSSLYAGHVDLGDMGQEATPANERRYPNEHLTSVFEKTEALARAMDERGYYALWLAEHHFQHEGYECVPNILMLAVHLAHVTRRLRFACGFNITPMWHPLRLAEDFATADILTGGRVIFGVGRGYHTREVETLGGPMLDAEANRELFEEQVEVLMKAFHEESFSHHGKHYTLPPAVPYRGYELREITLVPRPLRRPVECWQPIVSASPRGLDFMVKHRIKGIIGGGAATMAERPIQAYREAAARAGVNLGLGEDLCLASSSTSPRPGKRRSARRLHGSRSTSRCSRRSASFPASPRRRSARPRSAETGPGRASPRSPTSRRRGRGSAVRPRSSSRISGASRTSTRVSST